MLVELERYHQELNEEGEDRAVPQHVAVNPVFVSAVIPSERGEDATIVRGPDGRGLMVRGTFAEIMTKLNIQGDEPRHDN